MNNLHPLPTANGIVIVTPAMAKNWLEHRNVERQRTYSHHKANQWAIEMRADRWKTTHQGIAFDWDGFLLDGQHRLGAIVLVGRPVALDIRVGCDPDTFDVLDTGHKRTANQMIHHPHAKLMTSAARYLGTIDGSLNSSVTAGGVYAKSTTIAELLQVVANWAELGTFAASAQHVRVKSQILAAPHLAVLAQASRTQYADRIPAWLDGLAYGENLTGLDSRLHLRNRFAKERRALTSAQGLSYGLVVTAWNSYVQDQQMGVLRVRGEDHMPEVVQ
jgi:hypothetical protein